MNNRIYKFRAWDKRFEKMDYGKGDLLLRINEIDFSEPMQYTGLKDRTGKEIYEGDIVKDLDGNIAEVKWEAPEFLAMWNDTPTSGWNLISIPQSSEVIGNIYENPELIIKK